jgi:truncated hemoglobin YjbI
VRLVAQHSDEWLRELRDAMQHVDEVRERGPKAS